LVHSAQQNKNKCWNIDIEKLKKKDEILNYLEKIEVKKQPISAYFVYNL